MIEQMNTLQPASKLPVSNSVNHRVGGVELAKTFGEYLHDALTSVEEQRRYANQLTEQFIAGEISDVHSVTIAAEKASLALELTVQIRNKAVEAYQEIMRIQL